MPKLVNVIIVKVQTTELTVPDDFDLSPEGLVSVPGAMKRIANRAEQDTAVESIMIEMLPEDEQPLPLRVPTTHEKLDLADWGVARARLEAIGLIYLTLVKHPPSNLSERAMAAVHRLDHGMILTALSDNDLRAAADASYEALEQWVTRAQNAGYLAFWWGGSFVVCSPDVYDAEYREAERP